MEQKIDTTPAPIKPDLKHDTMEYAASTDGDDILDSDRESIQEMEDEEITAEELAILEQDAPDDQALALNDAETDSQADDDNFLMQTTEEDELGKIADDSAGNEEKEEFKRK